jgi:hypothetical protein
MQNVDQTDGYISSDGMWAAVPYGKKYMIIYNGEQLSVHKTLETAKKTIKIYQKKK